jgi:hypothetical protein
VRRTALRKREKADAGNAAADRLVALVGACEWCGRSNVPLCQHEISRGPNRLTARLEPCCSLVLCSECHTEIHDLPKRQQVLIGLAILWHSRGQDYNLGRFIEVECPSAPNRYTPREVELWTRRLLRQGSQER